MQQIQKLANSPDMAVLKKCGEIFVGYFLEPLYCFTGNHMNFISVIESPDISTNMLQGDH